MRFTSSPKPDPVAELRLVRDAAAAAFPAAQAAVGDARLALDAVNPSNFSTAAEFTAALDSARFIVAKAADAANYASARKTATAAAYAAARLEQLVALDRSAKVAVDLVLGAIEGAVQNARAYIAPPLALIEEAIASRLAIQAELREAGGTPLADAIDSMSNAWADIEGATDLETATNVEAHLAAEGQRAIIRAENRKAADADELRQKEAAAIAGLHGAVEQAAALARRKVGLDAFYRRPPALLAASALALPSAPGGDE